MAGPQDPLQELADLQGEPGAGGAEEEARGASKNRRGGVDHEETLVTVSEIGKHLRSQGKLKEAEVFVRRGIEVRELTLGRGDHPDTLTSVSNLGVLLQHQGKLSLAEATDNGGGGIEGEEAKLCKICQES